MKIEILTSIAGVDFAYGSGDVVDVEDDEAARWVNAGIARIPKDKTATKPASAKKMNTPPVGK